MVKCGFVESSLPSSAAFRPIGIGREGGDNCYGLVGRLGSADRKTPRDRRRLPDGIRHRALKPERRAAAHSALQPLRIP